MILSKLISKFDAGFYSFLSGVCVAEFMNIFTTIFASNELPKRWICLLFSSGFALLSAFFWVSLYLGLEPLQKMATNEVAKLGISSEEFICSQDCISRLVFYFVIATLSGIVGLLVLCFNFLEKGFVLIINTIFDLIYNISLALPDFVG